MTDDITDRLVNAIGTTCQGMTRRDIVGLCQDALKEITKLRAATKPRPKRAAPCSTEYDPVFLRDVWEPYPRKSGTSKKNAFMRWGHLSDDDKATLAKAIPHYARSVSDREESFIKHLEFFISARTFETIGLVNVRANGVTAIDPTKFTPENWSKILRTWQMTNNWNPSCGPEPGRAGCLVPEELLGGARA